MMAPHCIELACRMPLYHVFKWAPFHIDALGIVTMIGAEQVNTAVGRLVSSRFAEYLPLLGAYVIASNGFTDAFSGFALYNISHGIMTTDMAGWFSRWCLAQDFSRGCSSVTWTVQEDWEPDLQKKRRHQRWLDTILALVIGVSLNGILVAFTALQGDWWGLSNAVSMIISIVVRWYVAKKNRDAINAAVSAYYDRTKSQAKCFITFNDGKQINMFVPGSLVKWLFIERPVVDDSPSSWYFWLRMAGWTAFAAHVITIGQSGLATQIITVFIIVVSTILTVSKVGCDDSLIGSKLHAQISRPKGHVDSITGKFVKPSVRRQDAFIDLGLDQAEEKLMRKWGPMPLVHDTQDNKAWWAEYKANKAAWRVREKLPPDVQVTPPAPHTSPLQPTGHMPQVQILPATLAPKPAYVSTRSVSSGSASSSVS